MSAPVPPLYELLQINPAKMRDVWLLLDAYPPPTMFLAWNPRGRAQLDIELLRARYNTDGEVRATLRQLAQEQGLTPERIRVRIKRVTDWLHDQMTHDK